MAQFKKRRKTPSRQRKKLNDEEMYIYIKNKQYLYHYNTINNISDETHNKK